MSRSRGREENSPSPLAPRTLEPGAAGWERWRLAAGVSSFDAKDADGMQAMLSGEGFEKILQSRETIGQRVYERARTVRSESHLAASGIFQTNQRQMLRMGMRMARKFMAPENGPGPAPNP